MHLERPQMSIHFNLGLANIFSIDISNARINPLPGAIYGPAAGHTLNAANSTVTESSFAGTSGLLITK